MKTCYAAPVKGRPWLVTLNFPFDRGLIAWIKTIPGAQWDASRKLWLYPCEMLPALEAHLAALSGWTLAGQAPKNPMRMGTPILFALPKDLHAYQRNAIDKSNKTYGFLFNDEPGLGKSREFIEALKLRATRAIIVCPAQARLVWHHPKNPGFGQLDKWWPEHGPVHVVTPGKGIDAAADIYVVSYEMLGKLLDFLVGWDCQAIGFDEAHYLQDPRSQRSEDAGRAVKTWPEAWRACLTGTAITNNPETLCNPLNIMFPGRYGKPFQFAKRYCNSNHNGYGWEFSGVNEANRAELVYRLGLVSARATHADAAGLLPPFTVSCHFIKPRERIAEALRYIEDQRAQGVKKICLLTHHVETAKLLAEKQGDDSRLITGEVSPDERQAIIRSLREAPEAVLIASLHSVNVAIDMSFFPSVCVVESYSRPADMVQVLGRFPRLNSSVSNVNVTLLVSEEGGDPAEAVARKIEEMNKIIKAGRSESKLAEVAEEMRAGGMTKEDIDALLALAAGSYQGEL